MIAQVYQNKWLNAVSRANLMDKTENCLAYSWWRTIALSARRSVTAFPKAELATNCVHQTGGPGAIVKCQCSDPW
jgi:hypothetical protein